MKSIYNAILKRLDPQLQDKTLYWIDWDKGQLKEYGKENRPPLRLPAALVSIEIPSGSIVDVTDFIQDCKARVTITLVFDPTQYARSSAGAPDDIREKALEPYDVIATIYSRLQGYYTDNFDALVRRSQGEVSHPVLFVYKIVFETAFEDNTANV